MKAPGNRVFRAPSCKIPWRGFFKVPLSVEAYVGNAHHFPPSETDGGCRGEPANRYTRHTWVLRPGARPSRPMAALSLLTTVPAMRGWNAKRFHHRDAKTGTPLHWWIALRASTLRGWPGVLCLSCSLTVPNKPSSDGCTSLTTPWRTRLNRSWVCAPHTSGKRASAPLSPPGSPRPADRTPSVPAHCLPGAASPVPVPGRSASM